MAELDIQSIMEKFVRAFDPEKANGLDVKIQVSITGEPSGEWVVTIHDSKLAVEPGSTPQPNLAFAADADDVLSVFTGKLDPMKAYMQGKIQFKGDMGTVMKLMGAFRRPN